MPLHREFDAIAPELHTQRPLAALQRLRGIMQLVHDCIDLLASDATALANAQIGADQGGSTHRPLTHIRLRRRFLKLLDPDVPVLCTDDGNLSVICESPAARW